MIVSNEYRQEQWALIADPIIQRMAAELVARNIEPNLRDMMSGAFNSYTKQGGQHAATIGGPFRAIEYLYNIWHTAKVESERGESR